MLAMTFAVTIAPKFKAPPPEMYYPGERDTGWMA